MSLDRAQPLPERARDAGAAADDAYAAYVQARLDAMTDAEWQAALAADRAKWMARAQAEPCSPFDVANLMTKETT